jgi:tRNA A-37 threonylcarbamoyl transferase component Bud32/predicted hydrocarbon binding protein
MHGIIFLQFQKFAQRQRGITHWESLLREAQLPPKSYSPARAYPDEEMLALVGAASRLLDRPACAVLEAFGEFVAPELLRLYGKLIKPEWKTLDLIENTEKLIHTAVRVGNPGAQPPVLDCIRSTCDELQLLYSSDRQLCSVAKGIIKGVARHYGETVRITEDACMLRGDPLCALQVTRVAANEAIAQAPAQLETALYPASTLLSADGCPTSRTGAGPPPFLKPPLRGDELGRLADFRILQLIGQGAMGVVFRAEDTRLSRVVALKVMQPQLASDTESRQRFLREARAMAAIKSDHVVTVHEVGVADDLPFLAMEFLEGETLDSLEKKVGRLALSQVVRIGKETAQGLAAAHARGLVHRDIKPSNLWLEAPTGRVKVLDFGLARLCAETHQVSQVGLIVGTPAFMAPEQARGEAVDYRADLFSLGCVMYWLCTRQLPFKGTDVLSTLAALANEHPEPPQALASDVHPALSDLIMELLHKDPRCRPASSQVVVDTISAINRSFLADTEAAPTELAYAFPQC